MLWGIILKESSDATGRSTEWFIDLTQCGILLKLSFHNLRERREHGKVTYFLEFV